MKYTIISIPLLAVGCASYPPPTDHLASAIAATRGAQVAGAQQVPRAALSLKLAEEEVTQARRMVENGDNKRADFMTLRAYNDAQLALTLAREEEARQRAEKAAAVVAASESPNPSQTAAP